MFITLEDESANANLIVWPSVFERNRRTILSAEMMGCRGKVQHESGVIHLIVEHVSDLSSELKRISGLDTAFPLVPGRGDEPRKGAHGPDSRDPRPITRPRDIYEPDLHIEIKIAKVESAVRLLSPKIPRLDLQCVDMQIRLIHVARTYNGPWIAAVGSMAAMPCFVAASGH